MRTALYFMMAVALVASAPILTIASQPKPLAGEVALVVASPFGVSISQILEGAALQEAHPNRAPLGAFVYLDNRESYQTLLDGGAWLVLKGEKILSLC